MVGMVDLATVRSKIWVDLLWLSHISGSSSRPGSNIVFTTYSRYSHLSPTVSLYGCLLNNTHHHVSSDLVGILNHEQCWKVKYPAAEARASACWWYGTRNGILTVHCIVEYLLYCLKVAAPDFWKVMSWHEAVQVARINKLENPPFREIWVNLSSKGEWNSSFEKDTLHLDLLVHE